MDAGIRIGRRGFLGACAAGTGALWARNAYGANDTLSIGIIGLGRQGTTLLHDLMERPGVRVAAICDPFEPSRERARALSGARAFGDWRELTAWHGLDAVVVAAPDHWHGAMALAALAAGKDVYCERPVALSADAARAIRDTAVAKGRILQVGVVETSHPAWHAARACVQSGLLGRLVWGQGRYGRHGYPCESPELTNVTPRSLDWETFAGPDHPFDADRFVNWRRYPEYSGGVLTETLHDQLAVLLMATGPDLPTRVTALGGPYDSAAGQVPDALVMSAFYPAGHTLMLASSVATRRRDLPAVIRGEAASLYIEDTALRLESDGHEQLLPVEGRGDHLGDWLDSIRNRREPNCGPRLAHAAAVATAMAIEQRRSPSTVRSL